MVSHVWHDIRWNRTELNRTYMEHACSTKNHRTRWNRPTFFTKIPLFFLYTSPPSSIASSIQTKEHLILWFISITSSIQARRIPFFQIDSFNSSIDSFKSLIVAFFFLNLIPSFNRWEIPCLELHNWKIIFRKSIQITFFFENRFLSQHRFPPLLIDFLLY